MRDRGFADFLVGALACISILGICAVVKEAQYDQQQRDRRAAQRWALPRKRRRHRTTEDDCGHCTGTGACGECDPAPCRVCKGSGLAPRDAAMTTRLTALWDGAA